MAFGSLLFRSRLLATAMPPLARLVFLDWPHSNSAAAQRRIPACVGRPIRSRGSCGSSPAHPLRVPGCKCPSTLGHTDRVSTLASSPRARGKPWVAFRCSRRPRRVHPRACGDENHCRGSREILSRASPRPRGSSFPPVGRPRLSAVHPRVCGARHSLDDCRHPSFWVHPRVCDVRGAVRPWWPHPYSPGFIPARAGQPREPAAA